MQFYVLNPDPNKNCELLADYALMVNLKEGWQILSDIGHIYGIEWPSQNKLYSKPHPTTRWHCRTWLAFGTFLDHYYSCLGEYMNRRGKPSSYHNKYKSFMFFGFNKLTELIPNIPDYLSDAAYMIREKRDKMRPEEYQRLVEYYEGETNDNV